MTKLVDDRFEQAGCKVGRDRLALGKRRGASEAQRAVGSSGSPVSRAHLAYMSLALNRSWIKENPS